MNELDPMAIARSCTRFLRQPPVQSSRQILIDLIDMPETALPMDRYGVGELINGFEQDVATLLGKEAAVFMPSGTMCQQIALRIYADRKGTPYVAFHPTCHLELHEEKGYERLHHLHGVYAGKPERLMTLDDLNAIVEPLAALLIELPQREIGGQLPAWEELTAIIDWAREKGIPLHLDGARLWECQPFYKRSYAEIAALFDTVYVSFYKGLGGITGAILAGPADIIAEARIWQRRHGGKLFHLYPYVLSAKKGLRDRLDRMELYYNKAREVADILSTFPYTEITPYPPHTNMMHVFLRGEHDRLITAALEVAQETKIWLFGELMPTPIHGYFKLEISVDEPALELSTKEIADVFHLLFRKAEM